MIKNYFKIAWRSLWKNKTASFINISGLSVGLTCCLLMVLYLNHELSYDKFHEKGDRIVRVIMEYSFNGSPLTKGNFTSTKVLPSFRHNFPEVEDGVRMDSRYIQVKYGEKIFMEKKFLFADSSFFKIFSFGLLKGNSSEVLKAPKTLVISQSTALKYFGKENPVGKILQIGTNKSDYTVTGVSEDCPANSQIKFDFIASFSSFGPAQEETYFEANYPTYLLLKDKSSVAGLQAKIKPFMKQEMSSTTGAYVNYELEPYTRVHLYSPYDGFEPNSNITYIYIIAGIALLVLIIACFTYINLSTARSLERAKEVGIRKVTGAFRIQIFQQFITESAILTTIAMFISFGLITAVLPAFNDIAGRNLSPYDLLKPSVLAAALVIDITIALLAGSYPAFVFSKFQPVKVLKGNFKNSTSGLLLSRSLTVFQFIISVFLISSTVIISSQMNYIRNKKLGYDRDHLIIMNVDRLLNDKIDYFKTELKKNPEIISVSLANSSPVNILGGYMMRGGVLNTGQDVNTKGNFVDEDYIKTNGLQILAGRDLTKNDINDVNNQDYSKDFFHFVINEKAATTLGWKPAEAIGKRMFLGERQGEVTAVVKDFHFASMHNPVEPLVLFPSGMGSTLMVKVSGKNLERTITFLRTMWKGVSPYRPFEYNFMDDDFKKLYESENRTSKVFNIFSAIAILLACLGLFGLSTYSVRQRRKEIGIRKVLGASTGKITLLLSNNFLKMVMIAIIIATPLTWIIMNEWLNDFAYRIPISWWMFVFSGVVALIIAMITVSFQTIKAAVSNPVNSLRTE